MPFCMRYLRPGADIYLWISPLPSFKPASPLCLTAHLLHMKAWAGALAIFFPEIFFVLQSRMKRSQESIIKVG